MNWQELARLAEICCAERRPPAREPNEKDQVVDMLDFTSEFYRILRRLFSRRARPASPPLGLTHMR